MSEAALPPAAKPPRRPWLRFSLRTLLILVTLLCVWLAMEKNLLAGPRRAVEMVEQYHGRVGYRRQRAAPGRFDDSLELTTAPWLRRLFGDDYFKEVVDVDLRPSSAISFSVRDATPEELA